MHDGEQLEIKIPIPWSSEPVVIVCTGWRCILIVLLVATATATIAVLLR